MVFLCLKLKAVAAYLHVEKIKQMEGRQAQCTRSLKPPCHGDEPTRSWSARGTSALRRQPDHAGYCEYAPTSPWAGSGIRTFRSTPLATFVSQLSSLSLDEHNQNRLVVISATCPKHLNERLRNPSLKRSSYHGNGSVYTKWHCEIGAFLAPVGGTSCLKCCFCFFIYCLAQPLLLLQVIFP